MKPKFIKPLLISILLSSVSGCGRNNLVTVKFNTGYDYTIEPIQVKKGSLIQEPEELERAGYDFISWYKGATKWNFATDKAKEDMTLKAKWNKSSFNVNVTYKDLNTKNLVNVFGEGIYKSNETAFISTYDNNNDFTVGIISAKANDSNYLNTDRCFKYTSLKDDIYVEVSSYETDLVMKDYVNDKGNIVLSRLEWKDKPYNNNNRKTEYEYDSSDRLIKKIVHSYNYAGKSFEGYKYVYNESSVLEIAYKNDELTNELMRKETFFDENGNRTHMNYKFFNESEYHTFNFIKEYDNKGNLIRDNDIYRYEDLEWNEIRNTTYEYDENNRLIKKVESLAWENSTYKCENEVYLYNYDENGDATVINFNSPKRGTDTIRRSYHNHLCYKESRSLTYGHDTNYTRYFYYDENGNLEYTFGDVYFYETNSRHNIKHRTLNISQLVN